MSFASLLLELGLTRLFSVVLFYHFAFLAISVALLGLAAGGVFAALAMAAAGVLWAQQAALISERRSRLRLYCTAAVVAALALLLAANHSGRLIDIVWAKGMRRDQPWMEFARWNAISRIEVNR